METKRINIKQFDLANEKVSETVFLYIELADNYLLYAAEYYAEHPKADDKDDHSLGWEDIYSNFRIKIKRETFVSVEINWLHKRQMWQVELESNGYSSSIKFYFQKQKEAEHVYKQLDNYIFNNYKPKKVEQKNISARVQAIIVDKLAVDPDDVKLDAKIKEDLGADSLDLIEVVMEFEQEFSITIPDELVNMDMTVQQAITLVEERAAGKI